MPWARLSDDMWRNEALLNLSGDAQALFFRLLSYCGEKLTFGSVSRVAARQVAMGDPARLMAELVAGGLVEVTDAGWQIAKPQDYFVTKEEVEARRAQRAVAGRSGGGRRVATAERDARGRFL